MGMSFTYELRNSGEIIPLYYLSKEPWTAVKKTLFSVVVSPGPVRVPSQRPLAPSVASVTSVTNDDNEMILGAMHRSPGICPIAEETPRKP